MGDRALKTRIISALAAMSGLLFALGGDPLMAAPSNVAATRHNLSASGQFNVKATNATDTQICAFCHTPHGANTSTVAGPLWNRNTSGKTYTRYTSSSLDANTITDGFTDQPAGSSVLCLSCHDGMVALGDVNVLNGVSTSISLDNTNGGKMPTGKGGLTGFTRVLDTYLGNDHPISVTFNDTLAAQDGELQRLTTADPAQRDKITGNIIGIRGSGYKPLLPLEPTGKGGLGQVQCATCHDPHITAKKFLRLNRLQASGPKGGNFDEANDQICLACHTKLGTTWSESAHANPTVADETYTTDAATLREFTGNPAVWEVACLNCHDTHTVRGSRRLLREGVNSATSGTGSGTYRLGDNNDVVEKVAAIENTCYQCHDLSTSATRIIGTANGSTVPDIRTAFTSSTVRMPITTSDQKGTNNTNDREIHDITNADFIETPENLGKGDNSKRHVECTDCHNPHRVRRSSVFYGTSDTTGEGAKRTHNVGGADGNIASGVLRGAWGVEPVYGAMTETWPQLPSSFTVKKGNPGSATDRAQTYLTREYQLCFKCHSNYSNGDTAASFPALGNTSNGTPLNTNNLQRYTNVAAEFGSVNATDPATTGTDQGEYGESTVAAIEDNTSLEPAGSYPADTVTSIMTAEAGTQNHRSWHPVMWPTGRTLDERRISSTTSINFRTPFAAAVGVQTMHCSDCHGHSNSWIAGTGPDTSKTQGPHGSDKNFLLKGDWSTSTKIGTTQLCGNCHNPSAGTSGTGDAGTGRSSGFNNPGTNGGGGHGNAHDTKPCMRCHIAVPHGWKNKAFLVNLNCVGGEVAGKTSCDATSGYAGNPDDNAGPYTAAPYYVSSFLRVRIWKASGNWVESACGGNNLNRAPGKDWMTGGNKC
jgi:hypothetical protein